MTPQRLIWLDITKALAIILMVLGTTSIPHNVSDFIYAFHMPVFFLASGWCTNWDKYQLGGFVAKRIYSLVFPFIVYSSIVIGITYLTGSLQIFSLSKGWQCYALWFVPVLFVNSTCAKLIVDIPNN